MNPATHRTTERSAPEVRELPVAVARVAADGEVLWRNEAFRALAGGESHAPAWTEHVARDERGLVERTWRACVESRLPFRMELHLAGGALVRARSEPADGERDLVLVELRERHAFEERLVRTLEATSASTGAEFFRSLTRELAAVLDVKFCLLAETSSLRPGVLRACELWNGATTLDEFDYPLPGTPCEVVMREGIAFVGSELQRAFPDDVSLARIGAESYLGIRLDDALERPVGVLAVLDDRPLPHDPQNLRLLRLFGARAAAEIERVRGIRALSESEARYRALFQDSPVAMLEIDLRGILSLFEDLEADGIRDLREHLVGRPEELEACLDLVRVRAVNSAMRRFCGLHGEDAGEGTPLAPTAWRTTVREAVLAVAGGTQRLESEVSVPGEGGEVRHASMRLLVAPDAAADLSRVLVTMVDVTRIKHAEVEERRLLEEVQRGRKLESLGVLAGGIAHDFNNLLVGVLGNASLALEAVPEEHALREMLLEIHEAARHACDLSAQLLAYSGGGEFTPRALDVAELLRGTLPLLESAVARRAKLDVAIEQPLPTIDGDATSIRQVLLNLVTNAVESLDDPSGRVEVRIGRRRFEREELRSAAGRTDLAPGEYVTLEVRDTGSGLRPEVLERLFEPFYTTKFTGRGLGLAAVLGIVRTHGGAILVDSDVGAGSCFRVLFPRGVLQREPVQEPSLRDATGEPGCGTILVVDDEAMVRKLTRRVLVRGGYEVLSAADGLEALDVYARHAGSVRAVLLDMTMPRMDGAETCRRLRALDPDVRVLLSSGYEPGETAQLVDGNCQFIQKPYDPQELLDKLRRVTG